MTIAKKLNLIFLIMMGLVVAGGGAGIFGLTQFSSSIDYITGPAWDSADGAMEGAIGIEAQMLAVNKLTQSNLSPDEIKKFEDMLQENIDLANEALGRMEGAGLVDSAKVKHLQGMRKQFGVSRDEYLAEAERFFTVEQQMNEEFARFQQFFIGLEEYADQAVEELAENPNNTISWNSGLRDRWEIADGAMEANIAMLSRIYFYDKILIVGENESLLTSLNNALADLNEISEGLTQHPVIKAKRTDSGVTYAEALAEFVMRHEATFNTTLQQFYVLQDKKAVYEATTEKLLEAVEEVEELGDGQVESQHEVVANMKMFVFLLILITLVIGIIITYYARKTAIKDILQPILHAMKISKRISEGDLSSQIEAHQNDELGKLLSSMKDMQSRLYQVIEKDVKTMVVQAQQGSLDKQIETSDKMGAYQALCSGINELMMISRQVVTDTNVMMDALANGDLSTRITTDYKGEFKTLKENANLTSDKLQQVIERDIQTIVDSAKKGDLSNRIDASSQQGFYRALSEGINEMVETSNSIVQDTANMLGAMADGDLNQRIENQYEGQFEKLRDSANLTAIKFQQVIEEEIQMIVGQAKLGHLDNRILTDDKEGVYRTLSKGINELVATSEQVIQDTSRVLEALAEGRLDERIERNYQGLFGKLKSDANMTVDRISDVIDRDIRELVQTAKNGDLSKRIDMQGKKGFFATLSVDINELVDVCDQVLSDAARVASALADADLTQQVDGEYVGNFAEFKDDMNRAIDSLKEMMTEVKTASESVSGGSQEIAKGNTDLSNRTQSQASALQETASSMQELKDKVSETVGITEQSSSLAQNALGVAKGGQEVVHKAVKAMEQIHASSTRITDIISVIDEIAFQTNLLALNAAVEAARAGESGRGFAVVAGEVRNLAQRSAQAAKEISALIRESANKVDDGVQLVSNAGATLADISNSVESVSSTINGIRMRAEEQSTSIREVFDVIAKLDENTQQNAALVEEASASSELLEQQAKNMLKGVSSFKM